MEESPSNIPTVSIRHLQTSILLRSYFTLHSHTPSSLQGLSSKQSGLVAESKNTPCRGIPMRGCQIAACHRLVHLDIPVLSPPRVFFHVGHLKTCGRSIARSRAMRSSCHMTRPFALLRIIGERTSCRELARLETGLGVSWSAFVLAPWRLVRAGFASMWTRSRGYEVCKEVARATCFFRFVLCGLLLAFCFSSLLSLILTARGYRTGNSLSLFIDLPPNYSYSSSFLCHRLAT